VKRVESIVNVRKPSGWQRGEGDGKRDTKIAHSKKNEYTIQHTMNTTKNTV